MDLKQLQYFVTVAELGSFTRAAIALDVAQPALSRQVRLLEVELRQSLLLRNGRGVQPTESGRLLLEHARGVLHQLERTREALDRARQTLNGHVAIGLPPSLSRALTVPLTRAFRRSLPEATLSISEGLSSTMLEALASGRLDLALTYNASPSPEVNLSQLYEERWLRVRRPGAGQAASTRPIPLREVAREALIIPSRPNVTRLLVEQELARLGLQPRIAVEVDSVAAILDLVADGQGSALLSRAAVQALGGGRRFECRAIVSPALSSPLNLASSARRPVTPTQEAARQLLADNVAQWLRSGV